MESDSQTEGNGCMKKSHEELVYENDKRFTIKYGRKCRRLKSNDTPFVDSTSWLRDEAEDLTTLCNGLQARLRCVIKTLEDEQEL